MASELEEVNEVVFVVVAKEIVCESGIQRILMYKWVDVKNEMNEAEQTLFHFDQFMDVLQQPSGLARV